MRSDKLAPPNQIPICPAGYNITLMYFLLFEILARNKPPGAGHQPCPSNHKINLLARLGHCAKFADLLSGRSRYSVAAITFDMRGSMKSSKKKMTTGQKYRSLKRQAENAGMSVKERAGKLVVTRKKNKGY